MQPETGRALCAQCLQTCLPSLQFLLATDSLHASFLESFLRLENIGIGVRQPLPGTLEKQLCRCDPPENARSNALCSACFAATSASSNAPRAFSNRTFKTVIWCGQTWFGQSWSRFWPKLVLPNLVWPKLVSATGGLAKLGKTRWPNFVLAKVGNAVQCRPVRSMQSRTFNARRTFKARYVQGRAARSMQGRTFKAEP